jgi:hypothetical protein
MSAMPSRLTAEQLQRVAPLGVPLAIVLFAWLVFIQPRQEAVRSAANEIASLEPRVAQLSPLVGGPAGPADDGTLAPDVIRRLPAVDPIPDVLERLSTLALAGSGDPAAARGAISGLMIVTGERSVTGGAATGGPRAAGPSEPDPRVALFGVPLAYTRVTVTFESSFESLGQFLWDMRELPTIVEVHSLEVRPLSTDGAQLGTIMTLFVYQRTGQDGDVRIVAGAGGPS